MTLVKLVVPDLNRLDDVDTMYMKRLKLDARYLLRDYLIYNDTEDLYYLRELDLCTTFNTGFRTWMFIEGLVPTTGEQVFAIRRVGSSLREKLEVYMGGRILVNIVRQKAIFFRPMIHINDFLDDMQLRLKAYSTDSKDYVLQTKDKTTIGSIFKVTCKSPDELLNHLDEYIMKFPADLSSELKICIMVACFLIDLN